MPAYLKRNVLTTKYSIMDMDDDDRIVYGWDFSVTQQEQQDKRILGVRIVNFV